MGMTGEPHENAGRAAAGAVDGGGDGDGGEASRPMVRRAVRPGVVLGEELAGLGISLAHFARQIAVSTSDVSRLVKGERQLTVRMALRLGHWFGTGPEFWLSLQAQYDLAQAERDSGEAVRRLPTKDTPVPPPRPTGRPRKRREPVDDREVHLAHELPAEWVAELEKPAPPYETPLEDMVDGPEPEPGTEARERARRAAQTMDELSRGVTLDGLSLRELIGRDRQ